MIPGLQQNMEGLSRSGFSRWSDVTKAMLRGFLAINLFTPRCGYIARIFLAATIALGTGYYLQLEMPFSAATTVFLVANPIQGVTLSKGAWRVAGTILGAAGAVALISVSAQAPGLFVLGFAAWLGICTAVSTLFRHFRGYAAAVAGYTIALVFYRAVDNPITIFQYAVERVSAVTVGVVALALVNVLLSRRGTRRKLEDRLSQVATAVGTLAADSLVRARLPSTLTKRRHALVEDIYGVDTILEFSSAESPDVALRAPAVRETMAALFAVTVREFSTFHRELPPQVYLAREMVGKALRESAKDVELTAGGSGTAESHLADGRRGIALVAGEVEKLNDERVIGGLVALDRLDELLEDYQTALCGLSRLHSALPVDSTIRFRFHLDTRGALDNGMRAAAAIAMAGVFWIASAWTSAPAIMLMLAILAGLLGMFENPAFVSVEFTKGIILAVIAGFICAFGILPHISGFPLLILAFAPFWIAGIAATSYPRTAMMGVGFLLTFLTVIVPLNPMAFNVTTFLNTGVAFILAGFVNILCFKVIFPRNPAKDAARTAGTIREDVLRVFQTAPDMHRIAWEHLQHQRLARIAPWLRNDPERLSELIISITGGLHVARDIFRIRSAINSNGLSEQVFHISTEGLNRLSLFRARPVEAAKAARRASKELFLVKQRGTSSPRQTHAIAAAYSDIATLLEEHARFFDPQWEESSC